MRRFAGWATLLPMLFMSGAYILGTRLTLGDGAPAAAKEGGVSKATQFSHVELETLAKTFNDKHASSAERRAALKQIVMQNLRMGTTLEAVARVFSMLSPIPADDIGIPHAFAGAWPFKPNPELDFATYVQIRFMYAEQDADILVFLIKGDKSSKISAEDSDAELISCLHGKCPARIKKCSIAAVELCSVIPGNFDADRVFNEEPDQPEAAPASGEGGKK